MQTAGAEVQGHKEEQELQEHTEHEEGRPTTISCIHKP